MARRAFSLFSQLILILAGVIFETISSQNDNGNQYLGSILLEEDFENVRDGCQNGNDEGENIKNFGNLVQLLIDRGHQAHWSEKERPQKPADHRKPLGDKGRQSLEDYRRHIKEIHDRGDFKLLSILIFGDQVQDDLKHVVPEDGFYFPEEKRRKPNDALKKDIDDIVMDILGKRDKKDESETLKDLKWLVPLE